ncbi:MAG: fused MFS/spermidine synthase [Rhizobiales bacterium]|nr:fused MFS/spermidine synthase [Hyphomicrobiales bacterium]
MTSTELPRHRAASGLVALALPIFASALFLSAFLLFAVQPMFTKMVLPILGGSPSVWSVAMVFFQAMLLAGYCYAHLLVKHLPIRYAAIVHLCLMVVAFSALPIALSASAYAPPASGEATWLIGVFLASVGLPFFAVSGNGPLLQAWFARSGHPHARDPYFLYGASNVGSFAALIAYPLMIEPMTTLGQQTGGWTLGFALLAAAIGVAALAAMQGDEAAQDAHVEEGAAPTLRERAIWIALSAIPSGLLVSVTAHISTDVAAAPLLWVVPLALFLATFVLVFREKPVVSATLLGRLQIWGSGVALMTLALDNHTMWLTLPLHLALFFVNAMVCHTALYARRPAAGRLTEFYLMMSLGGVVGGMFCGLFAPQIFSSVVEYPLLLAAALFCAPAAIAAMQADRAALKREATVVALAGLGALAVTYLAARMSGSPDAGRLISGAGVGVAMLASWRTPARPALIGVVGALTATMFQSALAPRETFRSFFGVHKVREIADGRYRGLEHGTTLHGAMRIRNDDGTPYTGAPEPTTYYTNEGALAEAIRAVRGAQGGAIKRASLVGLGAGALACQFDKGETFRFFEIDPEVVRLASDPRYFRFLSECGGKDVVLGDARLTLTKQPETSQLLVIDAFSSDAIPLHLLTREALAAYLTRVSDDGAVVLHISNKYFDLTRILARTAASVGLHTYVRLDISEEPMEKRMRASSLVAALARDPAHLGVIANGDGRWVKLEPQADVTAWTDDYSNILAAVRDKMMR